MAWQWSDDWLAAALDSGHMWTPLGWQCRTGSTEFNERSIQNFPVQGAGAEILRITCIWATRHGLGLRAPVHDALLIEAPLNRIDADVALLRELMQRASRIVLNATLDGTHELRTDVTMIRYPDRYLLTVRRTLSADGWVSVAQHVLQNGLNVHHSPPRTGTSQR